MKKQLLILGFGWLGQNYSLETKLNFDLIFGIKRSSNLRYASCTTAEILTLNIFEMDSFEKIFELVGRVSHILVALPPSSAKIPSDYLFFLERLATTIVSSNSKIVFISSIGAGSHIESERTGFLKEAENSFLKNPFSKIIRFGGLMGADRHPVLSLAKSDTIINGADLVNLISIEDCCAIIDFVFNHFSSMPNLLTAVAPFHPTKFEYYKRSSSEYKVRSPHFYFDSDELTSYEFINKIENYGYCWINDKLKMPN